MLADGERWRVIHGDARALMSGLPDACVRAIVTDPPYGIGYHHQNGNGASSWSSRVIPWKKIAGDAGVDGSWLAAAYRILEDGGAMYLCCRWDVEPEWRRLSQDAGFLVKQRLVWNKRLHGKGDLTGTFAQTTEDVLFLTKGRHQLNGRPSALLDVGCVPPWEVRHHPHQKPVALPRLLIEASSAPGQLVLDPFCGSGTTGVACLQTGRRFLGVEIDQEYCLVARRRLDDPTGFVTPGGTDLFSLIATE